MGTWPETRASRLASRPLLAWPRSGVRCGTASTQLPANSAGAVSRAPPLLGPAHSPGEDGAAAPGEGVGVLLPEHVAHAAAGDDLQAATTLPHAEGDLCGGG